MTSGVKEALCYMHLLLSPTSQTLKSHPVIIQKTANINSKDKIKKNTQHSSHQHQGESQQQQRMTIPVYNYNKWAPPTQEL